MSAQVTKTRSTRTAARRRLNEALDRGVGVALQPIIDLDNGEIVGVEALARFPDGRPPTEWFAEAASLGLGEALEVAAVRGALGRLNELPAGTRLGVNVSAATACSTAFTDALTGAPAGRIDLEITEHVPVDDYPALSTALQGLRSRGMRVAVDDAGAGFSSMQHVLRLRPDVIKLDVSIVRGMDSQPDRRAFVSSLVSFARATGCSLVAEGIETAGELETARALGVGCAQGFHLGTPEAAGPARWQVTLPRRRLAARVRSGKVGRYVRPTSLLLAAALSWPGIVAVAGLGGRSAGGLVEKPPATVLRSGSGGPGASNTVRLPAAAHTTVSKQALTSSVSLPLAVAAQPAKRTGVLDGVLDTTKDVTNGVTRVVDDTVDGRLGSSQGDEGLIGGLLRRVLGRR